MLCGLIGKAMSGKDLFGKMLAESLYEKTGNVYMLMAFAKNLKERVQKDFDLSYDQLWGDQKEVEDKRFLKEKIVPKFAGEQSMGAGVDITCGTIREPLRVYWTPREILQEYGVFFRTISTGFWADSLFNLIEDKEYENVIITDVRFPNEMVGIIERGGINIEILREVAGSKINAEHISENALGDCDKPDFCIDNNGSLDELKNVANDTAMAISAMNKLKETMTNG